MNKRRKLVFALGAGAVGVTFTSFSQQQGKVWRVGFLAQRHLDFLDSDFSYGPFRQGMRELGYVEGKNLVMEWRSAEGKSELLPGLAAELVRLNVDALAASGTPATVAAQKATTTIPIIMIAVADPVANGLVKSLARPGGNTTGNSGVFADLGPTLLEILFDMVPKLSSVAILKNPSNPGQDTMLKNIQPAAQKFGVKILPVEARTPQDIEQAFSTMAREKSGAVIVLQNPLFQQQKSQIVKLAAEHRLPTTTMYREYVEAGGLMSYGANLKSIYRRAASYVDKVLKGAKPGDIPVEQPTLFELVINVKTAKALGLKIPNSILVRADKVIE